LGDVDNDPNTPRSEDGSQFSGDSAKMFLTGQSEVGHIRTIKTSKKRSL
jgi:hypothetical protein